MVLQWPQPEDITVGKLLFLSNNKPKIKKVKKKKKKIINKRKRPLEIYQPISFMTTILFFIATNFKWLRL